MPFGPGPKNQSFDSPNIAANEKLWLRPAVKVMSNASPGDSGPGDGTTLVEARPDLSTVHGATFSIRTSMVRGIGSGSVPPSGPGSTGSGSVQAGVSAARPARVVNVS